MRSIYCFTKEEIDKRIMETYPQILTQLRAISMIICGMSFPTRKQSEHAA